MKLNLVMAHWDRYFYIGYLILQNFSYGMVFFIFPNIMVDMKYILNTTYTLISLHPTIETAGYCLGPLVPLLYKKYPKYFNRQLVMAVFMILLAIATAATPLAPNLWLLYVCAFVFGFGSAIAVCGNPPWTIELFPSNSAPFLQLNSFFKGAGNTVTTLILSGYIVGELDSDDSSDEEDIDRRSRLTAPVALISCFVIVVSLISLAMYFVKPYKAPEFQSSADKPDKQKLFNSEQTPRKAIRILFSVWFTFYIVFETMVLKFAYTYFQYQGNGMSGKEANRLFSISTFVYTLFRFLNVFITMKFCSKHIIIFNYIILTIASILFVLGQYYTTVLWIASPLMFVGFAPMFALIQSFTAKYLTLSDNMSTVFMLFRGVFTLFTPNIIGPFIDTYTYVFLIVNLGYLFTSIALFAIILYLIRKYNRISIK